MEQPLLFETPIQTPSDTRPAREILDENAFYGIQLFYDVYETARLLNENYKKILSLAVSCKLDCLKIRGTFRVPWWAILEYMEDRERIEELERNYYGFIRGQETARMRMRE